MKTFISKKYLLGYVTIIVLVVLCISFLQWREHRLERRHQMLHKAVQVDLSHKNSVADTGFLVDSSTSWQRIRIDIKSKSSCNIFFIDGVVKNFDCSTLYKEYRKIYPEKYKNWESIELLIEIRRDSREGSVYKKLICFPFSFEKNKATFNNRPPAMYPQPDFNESDWFSNYVGWCPRFKLPNGYYYATATVINSSLIFKPFIADVEYGYEGINFSDAIGLNVDNFMEIF
jgi:hypothetical protein